MNNKIKKRSKINFNNPLMKRKRKMKKQQKIEVKIKKYINMKKVKIIHHIFKNSE